MGCDTQLPRSTSVQASTAPAKLLSISVITSSDITSAALKTARGRMAKPHAANVFESHKLTKVVNFVLMTKQLRPLPPE